MPAIADLARSDDERQEHIVAVLVDAFEHLIERDPRAFRGKFRKMAADPFAFYRGSRAAVLRRRRPARGPVGRRRHRARVDPGRPARRELRHLHGLGRRARVRRQRLRRGLPRPLHVGPAADGGVARAARLPQGAVGLQHHAADRGLRARVRGDRAAVRHLGGRPRLPPDAGQHGGRAARGAPGRAAGDPRAAARARDDGRGRGPPAARRARACASSRTTSERRCWRPTSSTSTRSPRPSASRASPTRSRTSSGARGSASAAPGCAPTTCWSRDARRRWRTTSCCP